MDRKIKPIETYYNNNRFRSRLEARWAVFFDTLGIKYEYEPEGFKMSDGTLYLPDFYLPESKQFFEVKGIMTEVDMHKITQFIEDSGQPCAIGYSDFTFEACDWWWDEGFKLNRNKHESCLVCCSKCGKYYFAGIVGSYQCQCCGAYDGDHYFWISAYGDLSYMTDPVVEDAILTAKQARFEHGEKG
ncbi:MAG: hypothetical protein II016_02800 [Erysipelotrichaceae bacterium]|nr:hypothetical protein [Erysipelotrichaceae bacterium]